MFFLSKKNETEETDPKPAGRLEVPYDQLKARLQYQKDARLYKIDIGDHTKEFSGSVGVPTKIQTAVRHVLDDYLKEDAERYCQIDEKQFGLFLGKANKTVAELKIQVIENELGRVIEDVKRQSRVPVKQPVRQIVQPKRHASAANQSKEAGTLSDKLAEQELQDWASRAVLNMATRGGYEDFQADIERLSQNITVVFKPLWYFPNNLISGYVVETGESFSKKNYAGKQAQEDLAIFASAVQHLRAMKQRGEYALLIVPVFLQTICGRATRDLFNIYCRSIEPDLRRFLVLRIKEINVKSMGRTDWDFLKAAAQHCRSIVVEPTKGKISSTDMAFLKFHAFGFDISQINLPEQELFDVIERFADLYKGQQRETFLLGIQSKSVLLAALNAGFSYVSGPIVAPYMSKPRHAKYMKLDDLYR